MSCAFYLKNVTLLEFRVARLLSEFRLQVPSFVRHQVDSEIKMININDKIIYKARISMKQMLMALTKS
jgi:hypothetical protein